MRRVAFAAVLAALVTAVAQENAIREQDEVKRNDGSVVHGKVIEQTDEWVRVATPHGVVSIKRSDVAEVIIAPSVDELYAKRLAETPDGDAQKQYELAQWCKSRGLSGKARFHLLKALAADPDHRDARLEMGYVRYGGRWLPGAEVRKLIEGTDLVVYDGRVMTQEEYERLTAPPPEPETQTEPETQPGPEAEQKPKDEGVPWEKAVSYRVGMFRLKTNCGSRRRSYYRSMLSSFNSGYASIMGAISSKKKGSNKNDAEVWVFRNAQDFTVNTGRAVDVGGYYDQQSDVVATYDGAPEEAGGTAGVMGRQCAYQYMNRLMEDMRWAPSWLVEGLAGYFEAVTVRSSGRVTFGRLPRNSVTYLKSLLEKAQLPRVDQLMTTPRGRFGKIQKTASWSLVHFMLRSSKYRKGLSGYVKTISLQQFRPRPGQPRPRRPQMQNLDPAKYFGSLDALNTAWRSWIAKLDVPLEGSVSGDKFTSDTYGFEFTKPSGYDFAKVSQTVGFQIGAVSKDARIEVLVLTNSRRLDAAGLKRVRTGQLRRSYRNIASEDATCGGASGFILIYTDSERTFKRQGAQAQMFHLDACFVTEKYIYVVQCSCFEANRNTNEAIFRNAVGNMKLKDVSKR